MKKIKILFSSVVVLGLSQVSYSGVCTAKLESFLKDKTDATYLACKVTSSSGSTTAAVYCDGKNLGKVFKAKNSDSTCVDSSNNFSFEDEEDVPTAVGSLFRKAGFNLKAASGGNGEQQFYGRE
jgi:hypothetical protein